MNPYTRQIAFTIISFALLGTLAGCCTLAPAVDVPRDSNPALIAHISNQPCVSAEAGYRAVYVLAHGTLFDGDFEQLSSKLEGEEIVAPRWQHEPRRCLDRGTVAFMICRACHIRTGVNWWLTGLGRYALRELQYRRIAGAGSETGLMTGGEFVGTLLRAEDYLRRTKKQGAEPVELPQAES